MCGTTGALEYGHAPGLDVFPSQSAAVAHLRRRGVCGTVTEGCALLGCAAFGDCALALIAKKVRTAVVLPNGHEVLTVTEAQWVRCALRNPAAVLTREERANVQALTDIPLENLYFYCETFDVTRSFAHATDESIASPDGEWVWNEWLAAPVRALGIPGAVPSLLQGLAESRRLTDANGKAWRLAVFGRRSRLHPGTRYLARGLNAAAAPGNEVEMEQLVWRRVTGEADSGAEDDDSNRESKDAKLPNSDAATTQETMGNNSPVQGSSGRVSPNVNDKLNEPHTGPVRWSSYVWRRGSVPIRWGQEVKQAIGEADIYIASENPYQGTGRYFSRLARQYKPGDASGVDGVPVTCVNLLRCAPGKPELLLSEHFHEAVRGVRKGSKGAGLSAITVVNFDWHANIKSLGEAKTVEGLWTALRSYLVDAGVSHGVCESTQESSLGSVDKSVHAKMTFKWQRGVLRYNCADSLDRTNLASYFAAIQVLAEQCGLLGLGVVSETRSGWDPDGAGGHNPGASVASASAATYGRRDERVTAPTLPPGWESRLDPVTGRTFYIDHNAKTTSWTLPQIERPDSTDSPPNDSSQAAGLGLHRTNSGVSVSNPNAGPGPWRLMGAGVDEVRGTMWPAALSAMCEIFLANGDLHAAVYTASRAIHTQIFHLLDGKSVKAGGSGGGSSAYHIAASLSNTSISAQRRFLNMTQDVHRQQQFEMFLGAHRERHFPSCSRYGGGGGTRASGAGIVGGGLVRSDSGNNIAATPPREKAAAEPNLPDPAGELGPSTPIGTSSTTASAEGSAVLTRPPAAAVLVPPRSMGEPLSPPEALLAAGTSTSATPLWVCPAGERRAAIAVWLGRPGTPEHLLLTSAPGAPEHAAPRYVDVLAGPSLDRLRPVSINLAVPRSPPGTPMLFRLGLPCTSARGRGKGWSWRDDVPRAQAFAENAAKDVGGAIEGMDPPEDEPCRVVAVTFRAEDGGDFTGKFLVLGHVEVLGVPAAGWAASSSTGAASAIALARGGSLENYGSGSNERPASPSSIERAGSPMRSVSSSAAALASMSMSVPALRMNPGVPNGSSDDEGGVDSLADPLGAGSTSTPTPADPPVAPPGAAEIEYGDRAASVMASAAPSLESLLELERDRLRLGLPARSRDGVLAARGLDPDTLDPLPALHRRDVDAHERALADERAAIAERAAQTPSRLSSITSMSPWEQLMGTGASVVRSAAGVVYPTASASGRDTPTPHTGHPAATTGPIGTVPSGSTLNPSSIGGGFEPTTAGMDASGPVTPVPAARRGESEGVKTLDDLRRRRREDALLAEIETISSAMHAGRLHGVPMGAEGAEGGADGDLDDRSPDSPSLPLRALLPDGSVLDANPTRRADEVTVGSRSGGLGIATSGTAGVGSGNDARSMVFVLPVRARVSRVVLRAGVDGVAAAGPGGPPSVTLAAGDDVSAVSSGSPIATWTLGRSDAMRAGSHLNTDSNRRALRGGEPVALVLAEPTPPARVLRLTAANVTGGAGSSSSGSSPFTGEDFTGTSSSSALEMRSARFVIRPSFPNPATNAAEDDEVEVEVCESLRDLADAGDPTRDSVARLSTRPEVARALEDSASPGIRSRVPVSSEEAHSNGSVLHVGLPPASRSVSGFRVFPPDPQPRAQPWVIRVYALTEATGVAGIGGGDSSLTGMGSSLMGAGPMSFETPREKPEHLGDFAVPTVRNRTPLCFDLERAVDARMLIFESVAGEGRDTGWAAPAPSLSGRVQCYRLQ